MKSKKKGIADLSPEMQKQAMDMIMGATLGISLLEAQRKHPDMEIVVMMRPKLKVESDR